MIHSPGIQEASRLKQPILSYSNPAQHDSYKNKPLPQLPADSTALTSRRRFQGWQSIARAGSVLSFVTLVANITVLLVPTFTRSATDVNGHVELFHGSCKTTQRIFVGSHLAINALSTVLLAASGACMQALGAPCRKEVDEAHSKRTWVHIGLFHIKNFRYISIYRLLLVVLLGLSSVPLHLFYNATIFTSKFVTQYAAFGVFHNFLEGDGFNTSTAFTVATSADRNSMADDPDMVRAGVYLAASGPQIVNITSSMLEKLQQKRETNAGLESVNISNCYPNYETLQTYDVYLLVSWTSNETDSVFGYSEFTDEENELRFLRDGSLYMKPYWAQQSEMDAVKVDECLARQLDDQCNVWLNKPCMIFVIVCNAVKTTCMICCLLIKGHRPLLTVGDAIGAFMSKEDRLTSGYAPLSARELPSRLFGTRRSLKSSIPSTRRKGPTDPSRWISVTSKTASISTIILWIPLTFWIIAMTLCFEDICLRLESPLFGYVGGYAFSGTEGNKMSAYQATIDSLLGDAEGPENPDPTSSRKLLLLSLYVAWPQGVLSILYMFLNNCLTTMILSAEYGDFTTERKTLRVSFPHGAQRSSYWLNIPLRYAMVNMAAWAVLHWLASEAIHIDATWWSNAFQGPVDSFDSASSDPLDFIFESSGIAGAALIAVGGSIVLVTFLLGLRKFPRGIPIVSTNSAAIASACHPGPDEPPNADELPLMFGRRSNADGTYVDSFTARAVEPVSVEETNPLLEDLSQHATTTDPGLRPLNTASSIYINSQPGSAVDIPLLPLQPQ